MTYEYNSTPQSITGTPDFPYPFRDSWRMMVEQGWEVFPLPPLSKSPPPKGITGKDGSPLTTEQLEAVASSDKPFNIGIRPPRNVIGIDVDAYGTKLGATTLKNLEAKLGPLPLTIMTTRRWPSDSISGIRWFKIPDGIDTSTWPGILGDGIELIRHTHRYAVAPPSRVHLKPSSGPILTYMAIDQRTMEVSLNGVDLSDLPEMDI